MDLLTSALLALFFGFIWCVPRAAGYFPPFATARSSVPYMECLAENFFVVTPIWFVVFVVWLTWWNRG
jgi:hypothetical protein